MQSGPVFLHNNYFMELFLGIKGDNIKKLVLHQVLKNDSSDLLSQKCVLLQEKETDEDNWNFNRKHAVLRFKGLFMHPSICSFIHHAFKALAVGLLLHRLQEDENRRRLLPSKIILNPLLIWTRCEARGSANINSFNHISCSLMYIMHLLCCLHERLCPNRPTCK